MGAAYYNRVDTARELIARRVKLDVNCKSWASWGGTPLTYAVEWGHEEIARMLVEAGADVNFVERATVLSPLIYAARRSRPAMVRMLLDAGADKAYCNVVSDTALQQAGRDGDSWGPGGKAGFEER